ncbi:MAG: hypothetical protein AAFY20_02405 [Cyanobacteria bacterium J06639_14]
MTRPTSADSQRVYRLYHYLCACLAIARRNDGSPNFTKIGSRLSEAKDFRRTVGHLFHGEDSWLEATTTARKAPGITTGEVVKMLANLDAALKQEYKTQQAPYTRVLTLSDMLTALYQLIELTPQERRSLKLPAGDGLTLLQRTLSSLQVVGGLENYEMVFRIYKAAVGLDFTNAEPPLENLIEVDALISRTVNQVLAYLPERQGRGTALSRGRADIVLELTQKAQREIRRILARSGNQQSPVVGNTVVDSYISHYLQPTFVTKLAQTVVANERLTDQFPVYLKRILIEASGPLPFADRELGVLQPDGPYPALLHPALRRLKSTQEINYIDELPGPGDYELASQESTKVTAEFYIKVPEDYQAVVPRVFQHIASENQRRIDFSLSSTGIGGTLSHVIKVINQALLMDIPCLKDYFSIAHDVTSTQTIIRENVASPVWAHSLVNLCSKRTVAQTVQSCSQEHLHFYEEFAFADPIGHGDYCGFDFLMSQTQAALQARLQAIRNAGISPQQYIQHVCHRTEQSIALQNAWSYLRGYPFSSFAMIGTINREILQPNVGNRPLTKEDPYIYFDACLSIVEALLDEGVYRSAQRYLERLEILHEFAHQGLTMSEHRSTENGANFEVFSGALIIRYLLCQADYLYIYDIQEQDPRYLPTGCSPDINREGLIQRAWIKLDEAQQHVGLRLRKYVVINEVSQGTFHPHYALMGRIAFLRVKLLLFFPRFVPRSDRYLPTERFSGQQRTEASIHWGRLFMAEKSRLYAAADGDSEIYACYAAFQCWLHLIAAYAPTENLTLSSSMERNRQGQTLSPDQCMEWAKKLRDHALISYSETGQYCYNQIKEKSGLPGQTDEFGPYSIQKLPAIYEAKGEQYAQWAVDTDDEILVLDMSLLGVSADVLPKLGPNHPDRNIYLFGSNACYLFFARGMYLLCSNASQEFEPSDLTAQPIQWEPKLRNATRLLNMAWAIAEDGGNITKNTSKSERELSIQRSWKSDEVQSGSTSYSTRDVDSVRDLYPRRVSEIVDLSKVFSAASMVLCLQLVSEPEQSQLLTEITDLLGTLHSTSRLNRTAKALLARQNRYNSHLSTYLDTAKAILSVYTQAAINRDESLPNLKTKRDALVRDLFDALISMP